MSTTTRRVALALLALIFGAAAFLLGTTSAMADTGNPAITGGLDHPYLPDAPATVAADPTTGCPLGYFYGDLNSPKLTDFTGVTCEAFQSDYDASVVIFDSVTATTCPSGYQREQAGDGKYFPHFVRCYPFATYGDPAAPDGYTSTDTALCAPGYDYSPSGANDGYGSCFVRSIADVPTPDQCSVSNLCTPPPPPVLPSMSPVPSVALHGSATGGGTVVAAVANVPSGSTLHYQWRYDGRAIGGATRSSFGVPLTYWRHHLSVSVSVSNPNYKSWSGGSASYAVGEARLSNNHGAYISGRVQRGYRVFAAAGRWYQVGASYVSGVHVRYQWYVDGRAIRGATGSSFVIPRTWAHHVLTVHISGTKSYYIPWVSGSVGHRIA